MANVIRKTPDVNGIYHYIQSVHTPDYTADEWFQNPDVSAVTGSPAVDRNYWKPVAGSPATIVEMSQAEKDAVDGALAALINASGEQTTLAFERQTNNSTFTRIANFVYAGSDSKGVPYEIDAFVYVDNGASGEIRIYDRTNDLEVTKASYNNTDDDVILLPVGTNWPTDKARMELQIRKVSGSGNKAVYATGLVINY